jgi:hypothetical protein
MVLEIQKMIIKLDVLLWFVGTYLDVIPFKYAMKKSSNYAHLLLYVVLGTFSLKD